MLKAIWRPLEKWPGGAFTPTTARIKSPFVAKWQDTLNLLEHELGKVNAQNITIQAQFTLSQIGNDRWPKPGTTPQGPAIIVSFTGAIDSAEYSYPCDTFLGYQSNLRAIALSLEALRKVERYKVAKRGEQYQGFRALPPGPQELRRLTIEKAAAVVASCVEGVSADAIQTNRKLFDAMFKLASRELHPDAGGDHGKFVELQEAGAVLIKHFDKRGEGAHG